MLNFILNLKALTTSHLTDEKGQGMVEYVLIIALIAIAVIAIMITMGDTITATFQQIINAL